MNLYSGEAGGYDEWTPHVVVASRIILWGRVADPDGVPLGGAHVQVRWPAAADGRPSPERSWRERFATLSDAAGEYLLRAPDVPGAELLVSLDGYRPHRETLPADERSLVTLESLASVRVRGRVVDEAGVPVAGARVSNGREERRSDEDGGYRIPAPAEGGAIYAVQPGLRPAVATRDREGTWPDPLELRLGGDALAITGRVVDSAGNGLRGVRVSVEQTTLFLARARPEAASETWRDDPEPETDRSRPILLENLIAGNPTALTTAVKTGPDGRFVLAGLLDRPYTLVAVDPMSLAAGRSEPLPAGTQDARIELATPVTPRIEGRVVDRSGAGVQGVTLLPYRTLQELHLDGQLLHRTDVGVRDVHSDDDGSFYLSEIADEDVTVRVEGPDVFPVELPLQVSENGRFEVVVDRSASVRFADGPWPAGEVALVDGAGDELPAVVTRGGRRERRPRWPLEDGSSPLLVVPTTARELVVRTGGEEVLRIPLSLAAGERRIVRP